MNEYERLRAQAKRAAGGYVGKHWPTNAQLRRDGFERHLNEHGPAIRSFVATWSPSFALTLLEVAEAAAAYLASDGSGIRSEGRWLAPWDAHEHVKALGRLRAALDELERRG